MSAQVRAFMSDASGRAGNGYVRLSAYLLEGMAVREAEQILAETEPVHRGENMPCDMIAEYQTIDGETNYARPMGAPLTWALADALRAFVAE